MIRKVFLTIMAIVSMCSMAHAYEALPVQPVEGEVGFGFTMPIDGKYHGYTPEVGFNMAVDVRYNIPNTPWACGVFIHLDSSLWEERNNRTLSMGFLGEYNFRQGRKVNPFASLGVGLGINDHVGTFSLNVPRSYSAAFVPKIGVEFWSWVRLNAYCQVSRKGYNVAGLTLGLTIGGWRKK